MKGLIRGNRRGVWHIPLRTGDSGIIHAYCGWVFTKPERWMTAFTPGAPANVCSKCVARHG
jgi:hypothetical protein